MAARFKIAFDGGLRDGFEAEQVQEALVKRFRMPEPKARRLFAGGRVILKKGLDAAQAQSYLRQLSAIGMRLEAIDEAAPETAPGPRPKGVHRIVFGGELLPGFELPAVREAARQRLKLDERQLRAVFSGRELGLKRHLDAAGARRYLELLRALGMDVWCDPPLVVADERTVAALAQQPSGDEVAMAERQLMETAFWPNPLMQHNELDDTDQRLLDAMTADFELPSAADAPCSSESMNPSATDLGNAARHMAETMLSPDALRMYEDEIAEAEQRLEAEAPPAAPEAARPAPPPSAAGSVSQAAAERAATLAALERTVVMPLPTAFAHKPGVAAGTGPQAVPQVFPAEAVAADPAEAAEPARPTPVMRHGLAVAALVLLAVAVWLML